MPPSRTMPRSLLSACTLALALAVGVSPSHADATPPADATTPAASEVLAGTTGADWVWPLARIRLGRAFEAPAHRYGSGHRGIDLRGSPRDAVRAPAAGTVAFSGVVAGRGILTIDHGDGLVTTFEPVESDLVAGLGVRRGDEVAALSLGGHAPPGALHFGVRLDGEYINPMLLLGGIPRAVLLPCC